MRYEILMQKQAQIGLPRRRILSHVKIKIMRVNSFVAEALCSTHYTSGSMIVMKNLGVLKHLKLMSLNLTDPNKRKHPRT